MTAGDASRTDSTPPSLGLSIGLFVAVTYGGTWLLLVPVVLADDPVSNPLALGGYLLGAFVPSLAGVLVAWLDGGEGAVRSLVGRLGRWRVGVRWYVAAVALPLVLKLGALAAVVAAGNPVPSLPPDAPWSTLLAVAIVGGLVPGAVGEELGWRGFALPRLQTRYDALTASLVLGVVWALWHLPTFFVGFTGQSTLPMAWLLVEIAGASVLYTWLVNSADGSVLLAVLFHAANNSLTPVLYPGIVAAGYADAFATASAAIIWLAAGILVAIHGPTSLSYAARTTPAR